MHYCLIVRIAGLEPLQQAMGDIATDLALQRLCKQLSTEIAGILDHQSIRYSSQQHTDFTQGLWRTCLHYQPGNSLLSDPAFMEQVVEAAETRLLSIAVATFGYATAQLANLQVVLVEQQQTDCITTVSQAFEQRYLARCPADGQAEQQLRLLLAGAGPRIFLQPIVDIRLNGNPVIGFEALARGPVGSAIERADQLFETARRCGLSAELERACLQAALAWQPQLPNHLILSVNSSAELLLETDVQQLLSTDQLWLELTEHLPLAGARQLKPVLEQLAQHGVSIALDDTGCGYADMQAARELRPAVVKLCITVIRALENSTAMLQELHSLVQQLHDLGCLVLAEGVETAEQLEQMQQLGVDYAQGWYFGRPEPAAEALQKSVKAIHIKRAQR